MATLKDELLEGVIYIFENVIFTGTGGNPAPPAGGFWQRTYPPDVQRPVVLVDVEDTSDEVTTPQRSATATLVIRAISEVSYAEARSFLIEIENAFDGNVIILNNWRVYDLQFTDSTPSLEEDREGGDWFYNEGDIYTVLADKEGI